MIPTAFVAAAAVCLSGTFGHTAPAGTRYVAMGHSYTAASGNVPPDLTPSPLCVRWTRNYPHMLATYLGAQLTDVTCGGAETSDDSTSRTQASRRSSTRSAPARGW